MNGWRSAIHIQWTVSHNEILPFVTTWMDLEGIMLSEISQRKTNTIWLHLYEESKQQTNIAKQKQTHRYREKTSGCQRGQWPGEEWNKWRRLKGTYYSYKISKSQGCS